MSHFSVIVCLPPTDPDKVPDLVEDVLAPFDENLDVEPYREYLQDWQGEYEKALRWFTEHPQHRPLLLDEMNVAAVLSAYHETEIVEETPDGSSVVLFYSMSTRNKARKWDWYQIGGRWRGYFPAKDLASPALIVGDSGGVFGKAPDPGWVDGGPKRDLDLAYLRDQRTTEAAERWDRWFELVKDTPEARPWAEFLDKADDPTTGYSIDDARRDYHDQPRLQAMRTADEFKWDAEPEEFQAGRDTYVENARQGAVPGWALLDLTGTWHEPGRMGWFATTDATNDSTADYQQKANAYIDSLPDDTVLVAVDCHI